MNTVPRLLWNALLRLQRIVMLATILFTVISICVEVVARYIFHSPIVGLEELAAYVVFWLYFTGGSYGAYERSHISADLSQLFLKNPVSYARAHVVSSFISTAVCVYAIPWGWEYFKWGRDMNELSNATFLGETYPVMYFQAAVPVGIVLMAFYFFMEFTQWFKYGFIDKKLPEAMRAPRQEIDSWIG